jgi:hypothetical protein
MLVVVEDHLIMVVMQALVVLEAEELVPISQVLLLLLAVLVQLT